MSIAKPPRNWPQLMAHLAYICAGLAIILVFVQLNLYCMRYNRAYNPNVITAVMMSNGQTYFGRLEKFGPHTAVLHDVFYLQVENSDGEATDTDNATDSADLTNAETGSNVKLIKLSDDFYQPNDYLVLNRDQILYWQHLDSASPIIEAMAEYESQDDTTDAAN